MTDLTSDHEEALFLYMLRQIERKRLIREKFDNAGTMKLFFCKKCADIVKCTSKQRWCECGKSSGFYTDKLNAVFKGKDCVPLGVGNTGFVKAVKMAAIENKHQKEPTTCKGVDFLSFVILDCSTSIKMKNGKKE